MTDNTGISEELGEKFEERRQPDHTGALGLSETEGYVGDTITLEGRNLPESEPLDVIWKTAKGFWGVLEGKDVVGPQYQHNSKTILSVATDESGAFTEEWEIPEDYGGEHTIEVQTADETTVAQAAFEIVPWFELEQTQAPMGETFTVTGYGLGPNYVTNNYQIAWDNSMVGILTGTANQGTATAEIRAVGPVGNHTVQVWRNFYGVPFLQNNTQSPFGPVAGGRKTDWTVEVTEPEREFPNFWMDDLVDEQPLNSLLVDVDRDIGADITIKPNSGQPGTDAFVKGEGFPPETAVDLVWYTMEGNHVTTGGEVAPEPRPDALPHIRTDENGRFQAEVTIPSDVGSTRPITAEINGETVARTGFMMQSKIEGIEPTEGPVGTDIEIQINSIGWTMYDSIYSFVYDNKRVGYVCGENPDDGVVRTVLKAAGEPGTHFIDVYPAIYKTKEDKPDFTRTPHLSYQNNHPVRPLPAFHFTFEVTE